MLWVRVDGAEETAAVGGAENPFLIVLESLSLASWYCFCSSSSLVFLL
jgi:hypothetical protein